MLEDWQQLRGRERLTAYYSSATWAAKRVAVIRRSGGWCERGCGRRGNAVHHTPEAYRYLGYERPEELEHLCETCHCLQHGKAPRVERGSWPPQRQWRPRPRYWRPRVARVNHYHYRGGSPVVALLMLLAVMWFYSSAGFCGRITFLYSGLPASASISFVTSSPA